MRVHYDGHEVMTYMGYMDLATGRTLVCVPGESYDISPDDLPSDGRFTEERLPETGRAKQITSASEVKE